MRDINDVKDAAAVRMDRYGTVIEQINNNDHDGAYEALSRIIEEIAQITPDGGDVVYKSFNHVMELYEYSFFFNPDKDIRCADEAFSEYYRTYSQLLADENDYDGAIEACKTALEWNPVDLESYLWLAEVYILMGNHIKEYREATSEAYRYCCTRATMARYYRNMGRYFLEMYEPETARAMYVYSNIYNKSEAADSALRFIESALNTPTPEYSIKQLQGILDENRVEPGPDADTIGLIYRVGNLMLESKDFEKARDCFAIVYDITQDEDTGVILSQLVNMDE